MSVSNENLSQVLIPMVVEQTGRASAATISIRDYSRTASFSSERRWTITANLVIAQLLFLQMEDSKKDINIYINSPGGSVTPAGGLCTMEFLHAM